MVKSLRVRIVIVCIARAHTQVRVYKQKPTYKSTCVWSITPHLRTDLNPTPLTLHPRP